MIAHSLTIVKNELEKHFAAYQGPQQVALRNLAEGFGGVGGGVPRNAIVFSLVNVQEEKALTNLPNYVIENDPKRVLYENPPVFLNLLVLVTATHTDYADALLALSRTMMFFQYRKVFTQDKVDPASITVNAPLNALDQLKTFRLIFDLCSPTLEEVNYMWATLGGKQYPFALYRVRLLDLKFQAPPTEGPLVLEDIVHLKNMTPGGPDSAQAGSPRVQVFEDLKHKTPVG